MNEKPVLTPQIKNIEQELNCDVSTEHQLHLVVAAVGVAADWRAGQADRPVSE